MSKFQFVLGVGTALGGSLLVLNQLTERRLLAYEKPDPNEKERFRYQVLLYRKMWEAGFEKEGGVLSNIVRQEDYSRGLSAIKSGVTNFFKLFTFDDSN